VACLSSNNRISTAKILIAAPYLVLRRPFPCRIHHHVVIL
jgi:hypothetical protein